MTTTFYKKIGKKYVPVSIHDSELVDSFKEGAHLVVSMPKNHKIYKRNIDIEYAPLIAASVVAHDVIVDELCRAHEFVPKNQPATPEQQAAWKAVRQAYADDNFYMSVPSMDEITRKTVKVMIDQAKVLLDNPTVKEAYDHFLLVAKLSKQ